MTRTRAALLAAATSLAVAGAMIAFVPLSADRPAAPTVTVSVPNVWHEAYSAGRTSVLSTLDPCRYEDGSGQGLCLWNDGSGYLVINSGDSYVQIER